MSTVQMGNVTVVEGRKITGPPGTLAVVESTYGPIISIGPRGGFQDLVLGFSLVEYDDAGAGAVNSDWPNNLSFPLFIQNVLANLASSSRMAAVQGNATGKPITLKTQFPTAEIQVRDPAGNTTKLSPRPDKAFVYAQTEQTGVYSVSESSSDGIDQLFAVNLLDPRESNLSVRDKLEIGFEEIAGNRQPEPARKEYWTWLALAGLSVLVLEWYVYNRRVFL
jgi:hypothetical protein